MLTHIFLFKEAGMHQGKVSSDDYLPYFSSKSTGDVLIKIAEKTHILNLLSYVDTRMGMHVISHSIT